MEFEVMTYSEFEAKHKKYDGHETCFVPGCNKPAYYEGGDARFYCGVCAEHARLNEMYHEYLVCLEKRLMVRLLWDKSNTAALEKLELVGSYLKGE